MRSIYLFLLAAIVGIELALGVFVAPVIFFPADILGANVLSHFQSGLLMTQIFVRFGYVLIALSAFFFIYELGIIKSNDSFSTRSAPVLAGINLALACLFVFYFTDYVLAAQKLGEIATTQSAEFASVHKASELVFKIMLVLQGLLFFIRAKK